jgi:cobalt-zinc-cadmium efflux system membrane fusion protein
MKDRLSLRRTALVSSVALVCVSVAWLMRSEFGVRANAQTSNNTRAPTSSSHTASTLELTPSQLETIKIGPVGTYEFPVNKETVGSISFADDLSVQVFPSYQGKIIRCLAELGDQVKQGQPLYTIESPDLIQAESNLIGAAATLDLTSNELQRAKLIDALHRSLTSSTTAASVGVVVDAKDNSAVAFYSKYGFIDLLVQRRLFLPMGTIEQLFP